MNIVKLMELPINEKYSMTTRTYNAVRRNGLYNILSLLFFGKDNIDKIHNLGNDSLKDLKRFLISYGINIDDQEDCDKKIKNYIEKKREQIPNIVTLLDKPMPYLDYTVKTENDFYFKPLIDAGYKTFYDVLIEKRDIIKEILKSNSCICNGYYGKRTLSNYGHIALAFMERGINFLDMDACDELIKQYTYLKNNKISIDENLANDSDKISEKLDEVKSQNTQLDIELNEKKKLLKELKEQLIKKQDLIEQIDECDNEFKQLIALYNKLTTNESGKVYEKQ